MTPPGFRLAKKTDKILKNLLNDSVFCIDDTPPALYNVGREWKTNGTISVEMNQ